MELLTQEIKQSLLEASADGPPAERLVIAKLFSPWSRTAWYVVGAAEQDNGDLLLCGWVDHGHGTERAELSYFSLNELDSVRGPRGATIKIDPDYTGRTLGELAQFTTNSVKSYAENITISREALITEAEAKVLLMEVLKNGPDH